MADRVIIYGKSSCPFSQNAKAAFGDSAEYFDIGRDRARLREMLQYSGGVAQVPVIVEGDKVTIGYGGT